MNDLRFDPREQTDARRGRYSLIDDMVEMVAPTPARYDMRTHDQRQQDDVAALRTEVNCLRDEVQYLRLRLDRMEDTGK